MSIKEFYSLSKILICLLCFKIGMSEVILSDMAKLFISKDALAVYPVAIPYVDMVIPKYESKCSSGTTYYFDSVNASLPYLNLYYGNEAYLIYSGIVTNGTICDFCMCTIDNVCYRAVNKNNYKVNFVPYCSSNECYMYGIVHPFIVDGSETFIDDKNNTYNPPIPYVTNLGPQSGYLKVASVGCGVCTGLKEPKNCEQNISVYNGTSLPLLCNTNPGLQLIFYLGLVAIPLLFLHIFVLYIFYASPEFNKIFAFKLLILHGVSSTTYFVSSIALNFANIHYMEGYWYTIFYAINSSLAAFVDWVTFLIALNRWDILGGLSLFPYLDHEKFFKVASIMIILIFLAHLTLPLIPGFRVFSFFVPSSYCESGVGYGSEVYTYFYFNTFIYYEQEVVLGLSFILYIWCTISIIVQLLKTTNPNKLEMMIFLQTLIPCLLLILGNIITYNFVVTYYSTLAAIVLPIFFQWESVHHPVLYLIMNGFDIYMFQPLLALQYYNDTISSSIGICSNIFAIYLVRKKTSIVMRQYSQTLLQNCVIDLLCNIVILITKEIFDINDGYIFLISSGFTANVPHPWDILVHMLYIFSVMFSFTAMVVPFYVRYRVLCRNDILRLQGVLKFYFFLGIISILYSCLAGLAITFNTSDATEVLRILRNSIFVDEVGRLPIFQFASITSSLFIFSLMLLALISIIVYILIIWLGIKIHREIHIKKVKMLTSVLRFHNEINRVLMLQAITPVVAGFVCIAGEITLLVFKVQVDGLMILLKLPISWMCVVNPFFAILIVSTYRKAIFHPFDNKIWKVKTSLVFISDK